MSARTERPVGVAALIVSLCLAAAPPALAGQLDTERLALSSDLRVHVLSGKEIELEVLPASDDSYADISLRATGSPGRAGSIRAWNDEDEISPDRWVRVPVRMLSPAMRSLVLLNLFPRDRRDGKDWMHFARSGALPTYAEGLWQVAEWFTGNGENFDRIRSANRLKSPELGHGQSIRIPASMLHSGFTARATSDDGSLEFDSDDRGPYAGYRLRAGEALYSAVVVRFTGRDGAEDVRTLADELSARSGVRDVRDIPVGFLIKIPFDVLEPDFLPREHPRRLEAEEARAAMARELAREPLAGTRGGLEGVVIVLDPGHGGRDLGTMNNGIWEHDYVYDVACRLKRKLERRTAATVMMTLEDAQLGCVPSAGDTLQANLQGTILTDPPFLAKEEGEAKIGVNLRWYLANSIYREAVKNGTSGDRVVFMSIHADSRHPSLRGTMVYVPGARYRTGRYRHSSGTYRKYAEVREQQEATFSKKSRIRSEAVSRKLADSILTAFRRSRLPVQKHQPVRTG